MEGKIGPGAKIKSAMLRCIETVDAISNTTVVTIIVLLTVLNIGTTVDSEIRYGSKAPISHKQSDVYIGSHRDR